MQSMPTYAIRVDHYADNPALWHAFTITTGGFKSIFVSGSKTLVQETAQDLGKLMPRTIAILVGDFSEKESGQ